MLDRVIIDKNASIGDGARLVNESRVQHADGDGYYIRSGIIIVPKGGQIAPGYYRVDGCERRYGAWSSLNLCLLRDFAKYARREKPAQLTGPGRRKRGDVDPAHRAFLELERPPQPDQAAGEFADARLVTHQGDAVTSMLL